MITKEDFLKYAVIEQMKYADMEKKFNVDRKTLSDMWLEHTEERETLATLRRIWSTKFKEINFDTFKNWYVNTPRNCYYCKITEVEIKSLEGTDNPLTKRNRGKKLEIDRKEPELTYDRIDNLAFCCYWCNNAKTDTFTEVEFIEIGKAIQKVWQNRLKK